MISSNELLAETLHLKKEGYRLAAITCTCGEGMELSYSFDKNYEFLNLRIILGMEEEISSISFIYPFAFIYENEIKELFGVMIRDITMDFNNSLYRIPIEAPFRKEEGK
ncbi:NADH-quinone oxidoreductase subunit C [Anaerotaenia torta]|uniref:NADH-quinone oxidoreductase subunit C n=1 Tax=Anaerotaenia torta TaxID=433293 RepID=UPI003D1E98CE